MSTVIAEASRRGFYERDKLQAGDRIEGPAIIEQYDTTTIVPPGFDGRG